MNRGAPIVYLAGPIANVTPEQARGWRGELQTELHKIGAVGFDPARAWGVPTGVTYGDPVVPLIQSLDDFAVAICRVVIVRYVPGVVSVGTDHEIELAHMLGKPVLVWADQPAVDTLNPTLELETWLYERFPGSMGAGVWGVPATLHFSLMSLTYHLQELTR